MSLQPLVSNTSLFTYICLSDMDCVYVRNAFVACRARSLVLFMAPLHLQACLGSDWSQMMNGGMCLHWLHLMKPKNWLHVTVAFFT